MYVVGCNSLLFALIVIYFSLRIFYDDFSTQAAYFGKW